MDAPTSGRRSMRLAAILAALALIGAACNGGTEVAQEETELEAPPATEPETEPATEPETEPATEPETELATEPETELATEAEDEEDGELGTAGGQEGAEDMEVDFTSPDDGATIEDDTIEFEVTTDEFEPSRELAGKENRANTGHWHLYLDDSLVNMVFDTSYKLPLLNLEPGDHTVRAVPALNDHTELEGQGDELTFEWDPDTVPRAIQPADFDAEPEIEIASPDDGAAVAQGRTFDIELNVDNFNLSRKLLGKADIEGYGHWHVNLDNEEGMLGGLLEMGTSDTITVSTEALDSGVHTFWVTLTGNGHAPIQGGEVQDSVEILVQ